MRSQKSRRKWLTVVCASMGALSVLTMPACEDEGVEDAAEDVGDTIEDAADEVEDTVDDVVDKIDGND